MLDVVPWLPELAQGLDSNTPAVSATFEHASFRALDAVSRLLSSSSRARPRVVLLEDMHRADDASWQLLRLLAPTLERCAVLIIVTLRSRDDLTVAAPVERNVDALCRTPLCHRFYLRGLEEAETAELAKALLGDVSESLVHTLHEKAGGNPLFSRAKPVTACTIAASHMEPTTAATSSTRVASGPRRSTRRRSTCLTISGGARSGMSCSG